MMKKLSFTFIFISSTFSMHAQTMDFLDINNVRAGFWADGSMFWDKVSNPLFEWPKDSGTHVNFTTGLWVGGLDPSNSLHGAYMRYGANGYDYYTGPLDTVGTASIDSETIALYNRVWKVSAADIEQFKYCWCTNPFDTLHCNNYVIPSSIINWPGNPIMQSGGQNLQMAQRLAPFYDSNGDGLYDPLNCDYPLIKCDQALFFVFNDRGGPHMESSLPSMGLEVRAMAYACSCDSVNIGLDDAIFLDLEVINRSTATYHQTYLGLYSDADIGGAIDDYMGTHVEEGYVYHYNADVYDSPYMGAQGYGSLPPAHAIVFLEGPYMDENGQDDIPQYPTDILNFTDTISISGAYGVNGTGFNDGITDNEKLGLNRTFYPTNCPGDPLNFYRYYDQQRTIICDSTTMVYANTLTRARFIWPDDNDPMNWGTTGLVMGFPWSELNATGIGDVDPMGDRRSVSSSGPFTLEPGETNRITYAFITARSTAMADSLSLDALHQTVVDIKNQYFNGGMDECIFHIGIEDFGEYKAQIYPNPASQMLMISTTDRELAQIRIVDITGRFVYATIKPQDELLIAIPVEQFASGIYTLIISNSTTQGSFRFIRN